MPSEETLVRRDVGKIATLQRRKNEPKVYARETVRESCDKFGINPDKIASKIAELLDTYDVVVEPLQVPIQDEFGNDMFDEVNGKKVPRMKPQEMWDPEAKKFVTDKIIVLKPNTKNWSTALKFIQDILVEKDTAESEGKEPEVTQHTMKKLMEKMSESGQLSSMLTAIRQVKIEQAEYTDAEVIET
jgi:hypothetical protein